MRSRVLILVSLVVLAVVGLVVGVAVAGAGGSDPLPPISAQDLLAKMTQANDVTAISGEISWHNGLFGDLGSLAGSGMAQLPAQSPLTSDGSGRIWVSDAGAKVESQGAGGDQVVVVDKAARTAWVYDYATNTVKKVVVTGKAPAETPAPAPRPAPPPRRAPARTPRRPRPPPLHQAPHPRSPRRSRSPAAATSSAASPSAASSPAWAAVSSRASPRRSRRATSAS
jgi:hypothetical protein